MSVTKKKEEFVEETEEFTEEELVLNVPAFSMRFAQLGALMRKNVKELKFDSEVSNIDYVYVDTQQYKELLGKCCDSVGVGYEYVVCDFDTTSQFDAKGVLLLITTGTTILSFYDPYGENSERYVVQGYGVGVSRGGGYSASIAQTNAMRNAIVNAFALPTSDRDDDVKLNAPQMGFLTDTAKAERRSELLEKTKSSAEFATVAYGRVVYSRIEETLEKDIPEAFRKTLMTFKKNKFDKKGNPIPTEENPDFWIVKKGAASKILSDLDSYK